MCAVASSGSADRPGSRDSRAGRCRSSCGQLLSLDGARTGPTRPHTMVYRSDCCIERLLPRGMTAAGCTNSLSCYWRRVLGAASRSRVLHRRNPMGQLVQSHTCAIVPIWSRAIADRSYGRSTGRWSTYTYRPLTLALTGLSGQSSTSRVVARGVFTTTIDIQRTEERAERAAGRAAKWRCGPVARRCSLSTDRTTLLRAERPGAPPTAPRRPIGPPRPELSRVTSGGAVTGDEGWQWSVGGRGNT